jgi:S-adenosylmethionine/arginine decarboxylase-like enzyme
MTVSADADPAILPSMPQLPSSAGVDDLVGEGKAWGISTALDLQDCHPGTIRDRDRIEAYVVALCELIGMKRYGVCQIVHFGEGRVAGYSMIQLIETSLISGHFADDTNRAYLDIFSCKRYDPSVVEAFSRQFFGARSSTASVTLRY